MSSGLVLNDNIYYITFHGNYDFAYFLKVLSNQTLPEDEATYIDLLNTYFPNYYDIRQLIKNMNFLKGSLSKLATDLNVARVGTMHQAGSDSFVTSRVFYRLLSIYPDHIDLSKEKNVTFGLYKSSVAETVTNSNVNNNTNNRFPMMNYFNQGVPIQQTNNNPFFAQNAYRQNLNHIPNPYSNYGYYNQYEFLPQFINKNQ